MTEPANRRWGIDAIACLYGFAAMMSFLLCCLRPGEGLLLNLVVGIVAIWISVGLFMRWSIARKTLLALIYVGLAIEFYLASNYFDAMFGMVKLPQGFDLGRKAAVLAIRIAIAVTILIYLRKPAVRREFESRHEDFA